MSGLTETGISVSLPEARTTFSMAFKKGLENPIPTMYQSLATVTSSSGASTKYPIMGQLTGMREWIGPRVYEDFSRYAYELTNKTFEKSVEVPIDAMEDDQLEGYAGIAEQIGEQARLWPDDLVLDAIQNGGSRLCFDGQFFFDTDHPVDPGNSGSSTYANTFTSKALSSSNFGDVLKTMQQVVGRDGRPMGFGRNGGLVLLVPPGLREVGKQIVEAEYLANGATNVNNGAAKLVVWDRLYDASVAATATNWYLLDTSRSIKPFIFQQRLAPKMTSMTAANDEGVFEQNAYRWGLKSRGAAGYGIPFLAAKAAA
jgi:phage major head subunit gpT-like protein